MIMIMQIIGVENLAYSYKKDKKILKELSFSVNKGEIFGFLGPNGSGKSTSQKIITGILKGFEGKVSILGKNIKEWDYKLYDDLGVLFEFPYLYTNLSAMDNLKFFASFYSKERRRNISELLRILELKPDFIKKPVSTYSKGMKQRTNMARALINSPKLLFLDEPTSGLDPAGAVLFRKIIKEEKERGATVFLTTHNMYDAELLCDRVAFIVDGKIVAIDTPNNFKTVNTREEVEIEYKYQQKIIYKKISIKEFKEGITFPYDKLISVHSKEPNLEDIFIKLTGRGLA